MFAALQIELGRLPDASARNYFEIIQFCGSIMAANLPVYGFENEIALEYFQKHNSAFSNDNLHQITMAYFGDMKGASVVDFGCGAGEFLRKCASQGASKCLGFDLSKAQIQIALDNSENE